MNIAVDVAGTVHDKMQNLDGGWTLRFIFDRPSTQFVPPELAVKLGAPIKPGDIVRCKTNPNHGWGIAKLVEQTGHSTYVLREIGGDKLCNMSNESVDVLRFMAPARLYTGVKYRIYKWATGKAFSERYNPGADYFKRCGGVEFNEDVLVIWSRAHIGAMNKKSDDGQTLHAQPKRFTMKWSNKTRLKDIVTAMNEQGFQEEFPYAPEEPTEGQEGYTKFTKDTLLQVLNS